jgi:hypothetical protein
MDMSSVIQFGRAGQGFGADCRSAAGGREYVSGQEHPWRRAEQLRLVRWWPIRASAETIYLGRN